MEGAEDETQMSEITIQPDGRVYVFGTSRGLLEVLRELSPADTHLNELLQHVHDSEV